MITVVMAYFNRQYQLDKTLRSFAESSYRDFNVVIVDDDSSDQPIVPEPLDKVLLLEKNKQIYDELIQGSEFRAKHIITPDLCGI